MEDSKYVISRSWYEAFEVVVDLAPSENVEYAKGTENFRLKGTDLVGGLKVKLGTVEEALRFLQWLQRMSIAALPMGMPDDAGSVVEIDGTALRRVWDRLKVVEERSMSTEELLLDRKVEALAEELRAADAEVADLEARLSNARAERKDISARIDLVRAVRSDIGVLRTKVANALTDQ